MGDVLSILLKESHAPSTPKKAPLPEAIDFAENAGDPNEVMECISILDEHVHNAMNMLIENDAPSKALDMTMKEIHAAFDGLPAPWISYCVAELLLRWHQERVEAMRREKENDTMRDPKRIPIMLEELKTLWETQPDWRLGQLIANLSRAANIEDPFFVQDDRLLEIIKTWNACAHSRRK